MTIPEGYIAHDGGECPVDPEQFVACIVRTDEGLGLSQVQRAKMHVWPHDAVDAQGKPIHPKGIGAVVRYRPASKHERFTPEELRERWAEISDS